MIDINKVFTAEEFKWYRNAMGLTQQEMADKLDKAFSDEIIEKSDISND